MVKRSAAMRDLRDGMAAPGNTGLDHGTQNLPGLPMPTHVARWLNYRFTRAASWALLRESVTMGPLLSRKTDDWIDERS
ncbi:MAG: hypothetical protein IH987_16650 [Planctomycetes bacterium]|nr:hypothetical protein [Planctomycetota bacterium]